MLPLSSEGTGATEYKKRKGGKGKAKKKEDSLRYHDVRAEDQDPGSTGIHQRMESDRARSGQGSRQTSAAHRREPEGNAEVERKGRKSKESGEAPTTPQNKKKEPRSRYVEGMRCSYELCSSPTHSCQFFKIDKTRKTGGFDWTKLHGKVLCNACYKRYKTRGRLENTRNEKLLPSEERCTYEGCSNPLESNHFYQIVPGKTTAGGQDWTPLMGSVLCSACYYRYREKGTLEKRDMFRLQQHERTCMYEGCSNPDNSTHYYEISEAVVAEEAGGQDWRHLQDSVLCRACYRRYMNKGTLEKSINAPLPVCDQRCTYEGCTRPEMSSKFYQIVDSTRAGNQDWSAFSGGVLCHACYTRYRKYGTLERKHPRRPPPTPRAKRAPPAHDISLPNPTRAPRVSKRAPPSNGDGDGEGGGVHESRGPGGSQAGSRGQRRKKQKVW